MNNKKCTWITLIDALPEVILGAEDDGEDESKGSENKSGEEESKDKDAAGGSSGSSSKEHDDADDEKVKGLKSALTTERQTNKDQAKELKLLRKEKEERELAEKTQVEQLEIKRKAAEEKAQKLAEGFLTTNLDSAIRDAAKEFIDASDAIEGVDRSKITYEQDEDDPSKVTIDKKSVEAAVKALSTKKPHFLKKGTEDGEATGSQFGGSKQQKKGTDEDELRKKYPSLGRAVQ